MTDSEAARLQALFTRAISLSPKERDAFLAGLSPPDRAQVQELILSDHRAFLSGSLWDRIAPTEPDALSTAPHLLRPGDEMAGYRVIEIRWATASSALFVAEPTDRPGRVALKVVPSSRLGENGRMRFRREIELTRSIESPYLATVFGGGVDEQRAVHYCAMQLVSGRDLSVLVQPWSDGSRPCDRELVRTLVRRFWEVATALAELHDRRLVHRDVKPANIVLHALDRGAPYAGAAVLVDFGLVREVSNTAHSTTRLGTPGYAAPEMYEGRCGPPADTYGLGLVMHDVLASCDRRGRERGRVEDGIGDRDDVDETLGAIVRKATAKRPSWRYPTGAALAADLDAWLANRPVDTTVPRWQRIRRWFQLHPRVACTGLVAALAVAIAVAIGLLAFERARGHAGAAAAAWADDDWVALRDHSAHVPRWIAAWALPADARAVAFGESANAAWQETFDALGAGPESGLLRATRFLERDGCATHPRLLRLLTQTVIGRPAHRQLAVELVARLFFERPDRSPVETAASQPLRDALVTLLRPDATAPVLFPLSALGGCGDAKSAESIVGWLEGRVAQASRLGAEEARLAYSALAAINTRATMCGFDTALIAQLPALVQRAIATDPSTEPGGPDEWVSIGALHPRNGLTRLILTAAALCSEVSPDSTHRDRRRDDLRDIGQALFNAPRNAHLREGLTPTPLRALDVRAMPLADHMVAAWGFRKREPMAFGETGPVLVRAANLTEAERQKNFASLRLHPESLLQLSFRVRARAPGSLHLHIDAQRSYRRLLPNAGPVTLRALLDGTLIGDPIEVTHTGAHRIAIPLRTLREGDRHTISLTITARSVGSLRIYYIAIHPLWKRPGLSVPK